MSAYEARRLENIKRNQALLQGLGIERHPPKPPTPRAPASQKRKKPTLPLPATRSSARLASATTTKPSYAEDSAADIPSSRAAKRLKPSQPPRSPSPAPPPPLKRTPSSLAQNWYTFPLSAPAPERLANGDFHFPSHPTFRPNKSPLEILAEGAFGGSYYRPLRSRALGVVVDDDWRRLPPEWLAALDVQRLLTRVEYDAPTNKFGVKCGQSIEEWEASGWIRPEWDVRGWFQWYERFFRGRRGEDDERQVGRWVRCVGERGRWRRALVKAYLKKGVRNVADEGVEEEEVSPVLCQTCHHWGWEMRQDYLDKVWEEGV